MPGKGRPFKKGQVANPNGRPKKGHTLTDALREYMLGKDEDGQVRREKLARRLYELAMEGSAPAMAQLYDRLDGRPAQALKVSGDADEPLHTVVTRERRNTDPNEN